MIQQEQFTSYEDLQQFFLSQPTVYLRLLFRSVNSVTVPEIEMFTNSTIIERNYVCSELLCMDAGFSHRIYSKINNQHFYTREFPKSFFYVGYEQIFSQKSVSEFLQALKERLKYILCGDYYSINSNDTEEFWSNVLPFSEEEKSLWSLNRP